MRPRILNWHDEALVAPLLLAEADELATVLPTLYGYHLVFIGESSLANLVEPSLITHQVLINPHKQGARGKLSYLQAEESALPLKSESVDVIVLSHALEHAEDPHEVLREAHRVLIPEGHVIITGFNPFSVWGLWHRWKQHEGSAPKQGRMLAQYKVRGWLGLLNFQIAKETRFYFRPPLPASAWRERLIFLERWGKRYWPFGGGAYTMLATKRVIPMTPIRPRWRFDKRIWQSPVVSSGGLPKPTTTSSSSSQ